MKKMAWGIALALILILALAGCGKEKAADKVDEAVQEAVINNALDGEAEVDIDGDKYTIEDSEGNKVTVGGTEWPEGAAAELLPKFDKGDMTVGVVTDQLCSIEFENVEKEDFEAYREDVKNAGFTQQSMDLTMDSVISYQGYLDDKQAIYLTYDESAKSMVVMAMIDG